MMKDQELINDAIDYMTGLLGENSGGHDAAHSVRVYENALKIAETEPSCDMTVVALASILHDVDDHKLFDSKDNDNAHKFLEGKGLPDEKIEEIVRVINSVSFSKNRGKKPETLEGKIVQDADRLDAMGAIGIARTFAYGGKHGRSIEDSVQHFHDKLLLLEGTLNTEEARAMAKERHEFLVKFLDELGKEI